MTEGEADTQPGMARIDIYGAWTCTHTHTHSHLRHSQTSCHWITTFSTLKTIVHFPKWDALELWVITGAHNQPERAGIISGGGETWRRRGNKDDLSGSGQHGRGLKVDWMWWAVSSSVSQWVDTEGVCVCVCVCVYVWGERYVHGMTTNQIMEAAGWLRGQSGKHRRVSILSRRRCFETLNAKFAQHKLGLANVTFCPKMPQN